ncbi:MAG: radical SAM protein [Bryobacteraceae bacterium]
MSAVLSDFYRRAYLGINYRMRTFAGGRFASQCRPTSIILLITERCNARCVHCDIWKNRGQEESPTVDQWKALLRDIFRWLGPVQVTLSGGEALLRAYTPELVAFGSSLGLYMEVLTHGYWMEQSRVEQLARAGPRCVTVSLDGIGATHSRIRGREKFWECTELTLTTLARLREEARAAYAIRLKTVIMDQNLHEVAAIAGFAATRGMEVFYQPIEQNYNTPEDPRWFDHAVTWPKEPEKAVRAVEDLIRLKRAGSPIVNSFGQLNAMISYFRDPDAMRVRVQSHAGHEKRVSCAALNLIQIQSNGDVTTCCACPPVGNIKLRSIREIWDTRPRWWETECCIDRRCSAAEGRNVKLARQESVL